MAEPGAMLRVARLVSILVHPVVVMAAAAVVAAGDGPSPALRWQALAVVHRITEPDMERVAEILPILVVDGFEAGEAVYFDDLRLYRLGD